METTLAPPTTLTALIYVRVSSDKKGKGRSVEEQEKECRARAEDEGWNVYPEVVKDNDRSASQYAKRKREGWAQVKTLLASGKVDVLVTWEASRAQRDMDAYMDLRSMCSTHGVKWAYSGSVYDLADRSDRFRTGLDALVAEDESERTRERVMRALRENASNGKPHGKIPFGYRREYHLNRDNSRELVGQFINEEQAALIREAATRFLAGEATNAIANDWNARNIPTAYPSNYGWQLGQIRRILTNPAINGKRVYQGKITGQATWEPIVDDDTFGRLQARFADPSRKTTRQRSNVRMLTGVARCGVCGGPLSCAPTKGKDRNPRRVYMCRYKACVSRGMEAMDNYVAETLIKWARSGELGTDEVTPDVLAAREHAESLRKRLEDAYTEFKADRLSAALLGRIEADLQADMKSAERAAMVHAMPTIVADMAMANDPEEFWEAQTTEAKRELVRACVNIVVYPVLVCGRRSFERETVSVTPRL